MPIADNPDQYVFKAWTFDEDGIRAFDGTALYLDTSVNVLYAQYKLSKDPERKSSDNGRGGGSGSGLAGIGGSLARRVPFILHDELPSGEGEGGWIYNSENDK